MIEKDIDPSLEKGMGALLIECSLLQILAQKLGVPEAGNEFHQEVDAVIDVVTNEETEDEAGAIAIITAYHKIGEAKRAILAAARKKQGVLKTAWISTGFLLDTTRKHPINWKDAKQRAKSRIQRAWLKYRLPHHKLREIATHMRWEAMKAKSPLEYAQLLHEAESLLKK